MTLLLKERHRLIGEQLRERGRVIAADLAGELRVSEDTIRRDLREMADRGECMRVYGGALALTSEHVPLGARAKLDAGAKGRLAARALGFLSDDCVIFLDASSTNLALANALPGDMQLTCITNAPSIAASIAARANCRLVVIGGLIDPVVGASIGAQALTEAAHIRPDICFLGACGFDLRAGVTADHLEDATFKRSMVESSAQTIVLATNEKFGKCSPYRVAKFDEIDAVVVESDAPEAAVDACRKAGIAVVRADPDEGNAQSAEHIGSGTRT